MKFDEFKKLLKKTKIKIDSDSLEKLGDGWQEDEPVKTDKTSKANEENNADPVDIISTLIKQGKDIEEKAKNEDLNPVFAEMIENVTGVIGELAKDVKELKKGNDEKSKAQKLAEIKKLVKTEGVDAGRIANNDKEIDKWVSRIEKNEDALEMLKEMPKGAGHSKDDKKKEGSDESKTKTVERTGLSSVLSDGAHEYINK